jgi:hypothetical protein
MAAAELPIPNTKKIGTDISNSRSEEKIASAYMG